MIGHTSSSAPIRPHKARFRHMSNQYQATSLTVGRSWSLPGSALPSPAIRIRTAWVSNLEASYLESGLLNLSPRFVWWYLLRAVVVIVTEVIEEKSKVRTKFRRHPGQGVEEPQAVSDSSSEDPRSDKQPLRRVTYQSTRDHIFLPTIILSAV